MRPPVVLALSTAGRAEIEDPEAIAEVVAKLARRLITTGGDDRRAVRLGEPSGLRGDPVEAGAALDRIAILGDREPGRDRMRQQERRKDRRDRRDELKRPSPALVL